MKKIAVCLAAFIIGTAAFTVQAKIPFIDFGVKFGLTSERQHANNLPTTVGDIEDIINSPSTGWHAGLVGRFKVPLLPVFVQGELLYNWQNIKLGDRNSKISTRHFSAPVLAGATIGLGDFARLRVNLGPVFNFASRASWDDNSLDGVLDGMFKKDAVTWTAGVGADLMGITLDVRYNGQFKRDKASFHNIDYRPTSWTVSLGFLF